VAGAAMYWRHHDSPPPEGDLWYHTTATDHRRNPWGDRTPWTAGSADSCPATLLSAKNEGGHSVHCD
jgi:hypothetical protein